MRKTERSTNPAMGPRTSNLTLTRNTLLRFSAVLLIIFTCVSALVVYIGREQDLKAEAEGAFYVSKALEARERALGVALRDYAALGETYVHLHQTVDTDWAYANDNLGPSLYRDQGFEGVFVVAPDNRTLYAVIEGQLSTIAVADWLRHPVGALVEQARSNSGDTALATQLFNVQGMPVLVAAAPLLAATDPHVMVDAGSPSVLIFVDRLTPSKLLALGKEFGVEGLHALPQASLVPGMPAMPLVEGNPSAALSWTAPRPGDYLMLALIPLIGICALLGGLMTTRLLRRAHLAASTLDASYQSLQTSEAALAASEARFRDVAEASSDWIWEVDPQLRFTYLSERFETVTGLARSECIGRPIDSLLHAEGDALGQLLRSPNRRARASLQCSYVAGDGLVRISRLSVREMSGRGFRGTASDITDEVAAQRRIAYLSEHDALTGLPNRTRMQTFLEGRLKTVPTLKEPLVMLSLDLDRFKGVNDLLGHGAGDHVLNTVARRLKQCLRDDDLVARIGGDEFVLVIAAMTGQDEAETLCKRLIDCIEQPIQVDEHEVYVSASIGIAMAPADATEANELLRYADIALYEAKDAGRSTWRFYAGEMNARIIERRQLEHDLRNAIKHDQLSLVFQPRYRIDGRQMVGAEALVRWRHPTRGWLPPDMFIPIAEETGLIVALGNWVLANACTVAASWPEPLFVSVNLSPVEFQRGQLVSRVETALANTGLRPSRLELELTESVMLDDAKGALQTLQELKGLGVRLALDDFGTGYSSLSYLRNFPFDGLKIDRSFICELTDSADDQSIIQAIVGLGRALSLTVTAEGIETPEQLAVLENVQCDEAQGYLLSRPVDATTLFGLIRAEALFRAGQALE